MKTIELTDEQWAALQSGEDVVISKPKPKQWEPAGGNYCVRVGGNVSYMSSNPNSKSFGVERNTKEQTEKAAKAMRRFNRLLAYRDEFDPDYVAGWNCRDRVKYHVFYNHPAQKWDITSGQTCEYPGVVYMSRDVAVELAKKLNSGEVVL